MKKNNDVKNVKNTEKNNTLVASFEEVDGKNEEISPTPESFYHDITTPPAEGEDRYYEIFEKTKHKTMGFSVASLIFGVVSLLCCYFGWAGMILGIIAIALSAVSRFILKYFDGICLAGLILGIFGVVFGGAMVVVDLLIAKGIFEGLF